LEDHPADRSPDQRHDPAAGRQKTNANGHVPLARPRAELPQRLELPPG
jgi:hypothetical protein